MSEHTFNRTDFYFNISECFGPTIQGEGRHVGRVVSFLRFAGCNLSCSWCDTPYSWDWQRYDKAKECRRYSLEDMTLEVSKMCRTIIVTGGEPLLQSRSLAALMKLFPDKQWELETNGTLPLKDTINLWSLITCSPKVIPSADAGVRAQNIASDMLELADFKFVIHDESDMLAVDQFVSHYNIELSRVWLMPEGKTRDSLSIKAPMVADYCIKRGYSFSQRLQVYLWGDKRGR